MGGGTGSGGYTEGSVIRFPYELFGAEREGYHATMADKVAKAALSGEVVAVQRNFDGTSGRVLDVYKGGGLVGYIHQEFDDMRCEVLIADKEGIPVPLDDGRFAFDEAASMLEAYVAELKL